MDLKLQNKMKPKQFVLTIAYLLDGILPFKFSLVALQLVPASAQLDNSRIIAVIYSDIF